MYVSLVCCRMYDHVPRNHFDECQREELDDIFEDEDDDLSDVDEDVILDDFDEDEEKEKLKLAKGLLSIQTEVEEQNKEFKLKEIEVQRDRLNLSEYEYNDLVLKIYESRANLLLKLNFIARLRTEILVKKGVLYKIFRDMEPCLCLQKMLNSSVDFGLFMLKTSKDLQEKLKVKTKEQEKEMIEPYEEALKLVRAVLAYLKTLDEDDDDEIDDDSDSNEESCANFTENS